MLLSFNEFESMPNRGLRNTIKLAVAQKHCVKRVMIGEVKE